MINDLVKNGFAAAPPRVETPSAALAQQMTANNAASPAVAAQANPAPTSHQLQHAVTKLNDYVQNISRSLNFSVDEKTGHTVVKVFDTETKELIRQIPNEETLRLAQAIDEQTKPLLFQDQA
jgi:flagellar protein FlaG